MKCKLSSIDDVIGVLLMVVGLAMCAAPFVYDPPVPAVPTAIVTQTTARTQSALDASSVQPRFDLSVAQSRRETAPRLRHIKI